MQNDCGCQQSKPCGCDSGHTGIHTFVFVLFILLIIIAFQGC